MANTSARMLRLLSLLQTHRYWPGEELADRLEVSPRTLRRDVDRLRELGYPVAASRGVAGGYQLKAGAAVPPLLLDDEEAVAVAVGLRTAAAGAVAGVGETSVQALAKVIQLMPPRLRRQVDAVAAYTVPAPLRGPVVDAQALTVIALACRAEEELRFDYTARGGASTRRRVQPHRLVSLGGRWYLLAFDVERNDWRSFRVDRMREPAVNGVRFRPRELPGGDAAAFVQAGIATAPARHQVDLAVAAPAAEVRKVVGTWGTVEPAEAADFAAGNGLGQAAEATGPTGPTGPTGRSVRGVRGESCRLRMNVDSLDWPAMVLGAIGAPFEIIGPPEFVAYIRSVGALFAAATADP